MSEPTVKRNPFAAPAHATMAYVLTRIEADRTLHVTRRRNVCSSVRTFARLFGLELSSMPAHPNYYRGQYSCR